MTNETYLIVSYFTAGLCCIALALAAYLWLRRSVNGIAAAMPQKRWGSILKRTFPISVILFAFSSFLSVDYSNGCEGKPYNKIIENRSYLVEMNHKQGSQTLLAIAFAVALWGLIVIFSLFAIERARKAAQVEAPPSGR